MNEAPEPQYKAIIKQIKHLPWETLEADDLERLMHLSHASALEFAEALRIALKLYPENEKLREMADGELNASNLPHDDYRGPGDHADFLAHFLAKLPTRVDASIAIHVDAYRQKCRALDDHTRAMTIFSREEELEKIFGQILTANGWQEDAYRQSPEQAQVLAAFKFYMEEHQRLDAGEGGHHDLIKEFPVTDDVAPFYEARLELYRAITQLFG